MLQIKQKSLIYACGLSGVCPKYVWIGPPECVFDDVLMQMAYSGQSASGSLWLWRVLLGTCFITDHCPLVSLMVSTVVSLMVTLSDGLRHLNKKTGQALHNQ